MNLIMGNFNRKLELSILFYVSVLYNVNTINMGKLFLYGP
jgi:hypothetical protein